MYLFFCLSDWTYFLQQGGKSGAVLFVLPMHQLLQVDWAVLTPSASVQDFHHLHVRVPRLRPATPFRTQRALEKPFGNSVGRVPGRGMESAAGQWAGRPDTRAVYPNAILGWILAEHFGRYTGVEYNGRGTVGESCLDCQRSILLKMCWVFMFIFRATSLLGTHCSLVAYCARRIWYSNFCRQMSLRVLRDARAPSSERCKCLWARNSTDNFV